MSLFFYILIICSTGASLKLSLCEEAQKEWIDESFYVFASIRDSDGISILERRTRSTSRTFKNISLQWRRQSRKESRGEGSTTSLIESTYKTSRQLTSTSTTGEIGSSPTRSCCIRTTQGGRGRTGGRIRCSARQSGDCGYSGTTT